MSYGILPPPNIAFIKTRTKPYVRTLASFNVTILHKKRNTHSLKECYYAIIYK